MYKYIYLTTIFQKKKYFKKLTICIKFLQGRFLELVGQFQNIHWSGMSTSKYDNWSTKHQLYKIYQQVEEEFSDSF